MRSSLVKIPRARTVALAVSVGVLSSFAFTGTSLAAAPAAGTACQASDGKINGRGATFQTKAQAALIAGYTADVCGPVAADPVAGTNMIVYNYPAAAAGAGTGSGAGQKAASCRTDPFAGSDVPFDIATLAQLNGAAGATGGCAITFLPPFTPNTAPFPDAADAGTKPIMSFPVAGGAVAIGVNLQPTAGCPTPPSSLSFTTAAMSKLFGGDISSWDDPVLVADNPGLAGCVKPIVRLVRLDKSGTTQTIKNYFKNGDGARTGATCEPGTSWTTLALDAQNVNWPVTGACSTLSRPGTNGGGALVTLANATDGGVAYADLADWSASPLPLANLRSADDSQFVAPNNGAASNCAFPGASPPGTTNAQAVGLGTPALNWAIDSVPNKSDVTFKGNGYPICGFTWDFVYTGLNNGGVANAVSRLTADQRRTLYSYFTYVFSPGAQSKLGAAGYAPLPNSFLTKLRLGFQGGF